jgi:deoxyribonuclease V
MPESTVRQGAVLSRVIRVSTLPVMLACIDVHYRPQRDVQATAAIVTFATWGSSLPLERRTVSIAKVEPYESGAFYKRELPCLLEALALLSSTPQIVIVDGLTWLGPDRPGLGARLHAAEPRIRTVVGVAKTEFVGAPATAVRRGQSGTPLWVDEVGEPVDAPKRILEMYGDFRVPTMLRLVDQLCRGAKAKPKPKPGGDQGEEEAGARTLELGRVLTHRGRGRR